MGRIVLFGATGYTGRLVAQALGERSALPVLAGRDAARLARLAQSLGGDVEIAVADAGDARAVAALVEPGDVLVSTVGPFLRRGGPALDAAVEAGAHYLDSTGEPPFVRRVVEEAGPRAEGRCVLLTAFGYDYVPGNLAGALALVEAGDDAVRLDVGYFTTGRRGGRGGVPRTLDAGAISTGTLASAAGVLIEKGFAWRDGQLVDELPGRRVRTYDVDGQRRAGASIGGSEHLFLPRAAPALRTVDVHLGWVGPLARLVQVGAVAGTVADAIPGWHEAVRRLVAPLSSRTGGGPNAAARAATGSAVVAVASSAEGDVLAEATLTGPNGYTLTGDLLAWAAVELRDSPPAATGALGPVEAFGLEGLRDAADRMGLRRT